MGFLLSAVIADCSKVCDPPLYDIIATRLDHLHNVSEGMVGDAGVVVAKVAFPSLRDPDLSRVRGRRSLTNVDMNRFQRVVFVFAEKKTVFCKHKKTRHSKPQQNL